MIGESVCLIINYHLSSHLRETMKSIIPINKFNRKRHLFSAFLHWLNYLFILRLGCDFVLLNLISSKRMSIEAIIPIAKISKAEENCLMVTLADSTLFKQRGFGSCQILF